MYVKSEYSLAYSHKINCHVWVIYFLFYFAVISTHFTFQLISFACLMLPAFLLFLQYIF